MINFIKKPIGIISITIILGLAAGGYFYFGGDKKPTYDFVIAKRADLIQEVSVTGRVKPAQDVNLAFEKGGKVAGVYVKIGSKVGVGQLLAQLNNAELSAELAGAEANVRAQRAKLDELKRGTRQEEIQVQETKVVNAKTALEDAKKNLVDKLQDAYTKADDAVRNKVDQFFSNPQTDTPQISFFVIDSQLETDIEWGRQLMNYMLKNWKVSISQLTIEADISTYLGEARKNLEQVKSFLDKVALAINNPTNKPSSVSQATWDGWKTDVATARTNINTALSNLSSAEKDLRTAESNLALAEQELSLKKAGTVSEQIVAQEAQMEQAEASLKSVQAQIAKGVIVSPFAGVVTKQDAKVGEIVAPNAPAVSLISSGLFEIESAISEVDIAKVKIGNSASVTFDTYGGNELFEAKVSSVDPAETIINGVVSYKITLQFLKNDERIKSGLTANVAILGAQRENALTVPGSAIITRGANKFVLVDIGKSSTEEREVEVGIKGSNGFVEIVSGLNEGEKVINFGNAQQ